MNEKEILLMDRNYFMIKDGFDIVIGNPPYIGEKGHKKLFHDIKKESTLKDFYHGKMDYFYFFFHQSINILKSNGHCAFITTNYYPTANGAQKLRTDIKERCNVRILLNLGELHLFDGAPGQHNMLTFLCKKQDTDCCLVYDVHRTGILSSELFDLILSGKDSHTYFQKMPNKELFEGRENYIRMNLSPVSSLKKIFDTITKGSSLLGKIAEVNTGIMGGCDCITKHNLLYASPVYLSANDIQKGDGVFVVDKTNPRDQRIWDHNRNVSFLKDFYKNSGIYKYGTSTNTNKKIIFSIPENSQETKKIIETVLSKFRPILERIREINNESTDSWYLLRRGTSHSNIFSSPKIVCPQRSKRNTFGYNKCEWFASADVYYITSSNDSFDLKYILGILNSKLIFFWLYNKGKRKGECLELYQTPLAQIPIKKTFDKKQVPIIKLVDQILTVKKENPQADTSKLEKEIDKLVYELYNLTPDEIKIIEDSFRK